VTTSRWIALAVVVLAVTVSLIRFATGTPSVDVLIKAGVLTLIFLPLKGALLRFLGAARPYRSALGASCSSWLAGIGFPLDSLGVPWPALAASFVLSAAVEWPALVAIGAAGVKRSVGLAFYVNFFTHLLLAGAFLYWPDKLPSEPVLARQPLLGGVIILVSFLVFILPIFLVSRPPTADFGRR